MAMAQGPTAIESRLRIGSCRLALSACGLGKTMMRPTVTGPRFEFYLGQRLRQLLQQMALILVQLLRRLYLDRREQVAAALAVDVRHALAAQPKRGAGLRAFGHLDAFLAVERRHENLSAER